MTDSSKFLEFLSSLDTEQRRAMVALIDNSSSKNAHAPTTSSPHSRPIERNPDVETATLDSSERLLGLKTLSGANINPVGIQSSSRMPIRSSVLHDTNDDDNNLDRIATVRDEDYDDLNIDFDALASDHEQNAENLLLSMDDAAGMVMKIDRAHSTAASNDHEMATSRSSSTATGVTISRSSSTATGVTTASVKRSRVLRRAFGIAVQDAEAKHQRSTQFWQNVIDQRNLELETAQQVKDLSDKSLGQMFASSSYVVPGNDALTAFFEKNKFLKFLRSCCQQYSSTGGLVVEDFTHLRNIVQRGLRAKDDSLANDASESIYDHKNAKAIRRRWCEFIFSAYLFCFPVCSPDEPDNILPHIGDDDDDQVGVGHSFGDRMNNSSQQQIFPDLICKHVFFNQSTIVNGDQIITLPTREEIASVLQASIRATQRNPPTDHQRSQKRDKQKFYRQETKRKHDQIVAEDLEAAKRNQFAFQSVAAAAQTTMNSTGNVSYQQQIERATTDAFYDHNSNFAIDRPPLPQPHQSPSVRRSRGGGGRGGGEGRGGTNGTLRETTSQRSRSRRRGGGQAGNNNATQDEVNELQRLQETAHNIERYQQTFGNQDMFIHPESSSSTSRMTHNERMDVYYALQNTNMMAADTGCQQSEYIFNEEDF